MGQMEQKMTSRSLGKTGIIVGSVGMGCMPLSLNEHRPSEAEAIKTIHAALEEGITLFDTADVYCLEASEWGHNERLIAKALQHRPDVTIATKGGRMFQPDGRRDSDGSPAHLRSACEHSLKALGVEAIDLYQFHRPDPKVPLTESVGALADLQREGKIRHVGLSNVSVMELEEALLYVEVVSVQNSLNVFNHSSMDVLKRCEQNGISFLPHSPLGGMGKAGRLADNETVMRIAGVHEASPQQVALAWLLQLSPVIIPIPGATKITSIVDSARAALQTLAVEEMAQLHAVGNGSV